MNFFSNLDEIGPGISQKMEEEVFVCGVADLYDYCNAACTRPKTCTKVVNYWIRGA